MDVDVESLDFMESDVAEEVVVGSAAEFVSGHLEGSGSHIKQERAGAGVRESPTSGEARQPTVIQVHPSAASAQPRVIRIQTTGASMQPVAGGAVSSGGGGDTGGKPVRVIRLPVQKLTSGGQQQSSTGSIKIITLPPRSQQHHQQQQQIVRQVGSGTQQQQGQTLRVITATGAQRIIQVRSLPMQQQQHQPQQQQQQQRKLGTGSVQARGFLPDPKMKAVTPTSGRGVFGLGFAPRARGSAGPAGGEEWMEDDDYTGSGARGGSGLRKYAGAVVDKLQNKNITSYYEVADELVHEFAAEHPLMPQDQLIYHQKNIRRRAYDTLNVLLAMGVIRRDNKEISWVGMPLNAIVQCRKLQDEREERLKRIREKANEISEKVCQLIAFKQLVKRNRENEQMYGQAPKASLLHLPFLVISCPPNTVTDCNITKDKLEYLFTFDHTFEISDDTAVLRSLGYQLATNNEPVDDIIECVPPSLRFFVNALYERREAVVPDFESVHAQRKLEAAAGAAVAGAGAGIPQIIQAIPSAVVGGLGHHHHHPHSQMVPLSDSEIEEEEGSDIEVEVGA